LSQAELFGADGSSFGGVSYKLNVDANTIESSRVEDDSALELEYTYNDSGDLVTAVGLSISDSFAPLGE